ncbi:omega-amidase, chloroplastic [Cryptomeria japonica]|uniref:omega-amidase, chloroplastic n=1 Tax=Cryptomeria japonica TaxID=3369 RepID=UPI0027D9DF52|nr:omega-amidase, chloroplastic [Cryptomeria japonica]
MAAYDLNSKWYALRPRRAPLSHDEEVKEGFMKALAKMYTKEESAILCTQWLAFANLHGPTFNRVEVRSDRATLAQIDPIGFRWMWHGKDALELRDGWTLSLYWDVNSEDAMQIDVEEIQEGLVGVPLLEEIWNGPYSNASFPVYAEDIDAGGSASPSTTMLSEVARSKGITIVGGSISERNGDHLYNTCCIFGKDGELKGKHRKIHLFDIDIPGKISFKESKTLTPGNTPTVVETDVGRIGIGICYDIRFQELATLYAARGVHLICYPGAFNMTTGPLHWELLQRARAVDNQLYVATCSPVRDITAGYIAWGHSTLVGPFGEVIATTEHEETTVIADIDYSLIEERRMNLPLGTQRRGDLYQLVDFDRLNLENH